MITNDRGLSYYCSVSIYLPSVKLLGLSQMRLIKINVIIECFIKRRRTVIFLSSYNDILNCQSVFVTTFQSFVEILHNYSLINLVTVAIQVRVAEKAIALRGTFLWRITEVYDYGRMFGISEDFNAIISQGECAMLKSVFHGRFF